MQPSYIKYLGIENFRIFSKAAEFDFRPITVLTGKNSSGKSSLIKSLLLFKETFESSNNIDFLQFERANLGPFSNNIPRIKGANQKNMAFAFDINFPALKDDYKVILHYYNPNHENSPGAGTWQKGLEIKRNDGKLIFSMKHGDWDGADGQQYLMSYDLNEVFAECRDSLIVRAKEMKKVNRKWDFSEQKKIEDKEIELRKNPLYHSASKNFDLKNTRIFISSKSAKEIVDIDKGKLTFFDYSFNGDKVKLTDEEIEKMESVDFLSNIKSKPYEEWIWFDDRMINQSGLNNIFNLSSFFLKNIYGEAEEIQEKKCEDFPGLADHKAKVSRATQLILEEGFHKPLKEFESQLKESLKNIYHLPPSRMNHERVSMIKDNKVMKSFTEFGEEEVVRYPKLQKFLDFSVDLFEIPGTPIVKTFEGQAASIYLRNDGEEHSITDYGFGFSQLVPLIVTIYNLAKNSFDGEDPWGEFYKDGVIIVEEPEANLHPNFQSKIADLISEASRMFGIQFIIETHSEYMIRKFQYLTAKKDLKPSDTAIYYFNDPKKHKDVDQVNRLTIREDGFMDEDFGPGFFDESTRLTLELLKIQSLN